MAFDEGLFNFYRAAIAMRHDSAALRRGEIEFVKADDPGQFLGFRRVRCAGNDACGSEPRRCAISMEGSARRGRDGRTSFHRLRRSRSREDRAERAGKSVVTVPALDGVVLRVSPKN